MLNTLDFLSGNKTDRHFIDGQRTAYLELREYTYYIYSRGVSRIDRIYVREDQFYRTTNWEIAPKPLILDYRPVEFKLRVNPNATTRKGQGRQRLNLGILTRLQNVEKCERLLGRTEELGGSQSTFKQKVKEYLSIVITTQRRERQKLQGNLRKRRLNLIKKKQRIELPNIKHYTIEKKIAAIVTQEDCLVEQQLRSRKINALSKHMLLNEKPTKQFFQRAKTQSNQTIETLIDKQGVERTSTSELLEVAQEYYIDLFSPNPTESNSQQFILNQIKAQIDERTAKAITKPITRREIVLLIRRAATRKSPGINGLTSEFYKKLLRPPRTYTKEQRKEFKPEGAPLVNQLKALYDEIQATNSLPDEQTDGVLTVLFKNKGERNNLKYYRPLTLMNVDYKIYTEILIQRLVKVLDQTVGNY